LVMSLPLLPMNKQQAAAPQVNVILWPGQKDFETYKTTEKLNLMTKGMHVLDKSEVSTASDWRLEYTGLANSISMHWYVHVINTPNRIFIATGAAPESMWGDYGDKIKQCVDSLKATGTAQFAPPPTPLTSDAPSTSNSTTSLPSK